MTTLAQDLADVPLPCPFCGSKNHHLMPPTCNRKSAYDPADRAFPIIRCGCGGEVHGKNWDDSCKSAITAWNRRSPALAALVEDADRYRWLRARSPYMSSPGGHVAWPDYFGGKYQGACYPNREDLDARIDAARAESAK